MLAAAKLLKAREAELKGTVVLIFQPAEEGGAGAKFMAEEGALDGVEAVHGIHVMPMMPTGIITTKASPFLLRFPTWLEQFFSGSLIFQAFLKLCNLLCLSWGR